MTFSSDRRPRDRFGRIYLRKSTIEYFQDCPTKYLWADIEGLQPIKLSPDDPRAWGTAVHSGLEPCWGGRTDRAAPAVDSAFPGRFENAIQLEQWAKARAALEGYLRRWEVGQADNASGVLLALETRWTAPLMVSEERESERWALSGRFDAAKWIAPQNPRPSWGDQEVSPGNYIIEHKTARTIDAQYIEKIWADMQTLLYGDALEQITGEPTAGVLYDVIGKSGLKMRKAETHQEFIERSGRLQEQAERGLMGRRLRLRKGETSDEFQARRIVKGREESRMAQPVQAEPLSEYEERLSVWYDKPEAFLRVMTATDRARRLAVIQNIAKTSEHIAWCEDTGNWTQSTRECHRPGITCDYWPICSSGNDHWTIENGYRVREDNNAEIHSADDAQTDSGQP